MRARQRLSARGQALCLRRLALALCLLAASPGSRPASVPCEGLGAHAAVRRPTEPRQDLLQLRGGAPARRRPAPPGTPARAARGKSRQPKQLPVQEREDASGRSNAELEESKAGGTQGKGRAGMVAAEADDRRKQGPVAQAEPTPPGRATPGHKRASSDVVTGEYFKKALRAVEAAAADRQGSMQAPRNASSAPFRPGAADAAGESAFDGPVSKQQDADGKDDEEQAADGSVPAMRRSAFVPVIYDDVLGRPPVRERDEWLELFRSMDTYTNIIDLKFVKDVLESTGVQCVDKATLKFAGFLVDAYICRVCSYSADWVRLRLQGEEEMKEAAARGSNKAFVRDDVLKRMRNLNFTLIQSDVLHALHEMSPGSDLPFLEHAILPRADAAEREGSSSWSQCESESVSQQSLPLDHDAAQVYLPPAAYALRAACAGQPRGGRVRACERQQRCSRHRRCVCKARLLQAESRASRVGPVGERRLRCCGRCH